MSLMTSDPQDALNIYLINKLDVDGVLRLKAVELAIAFCKENHMLSPNQFSKVYESCYEFLKPKIPLNE